MIYQSNHRCASALLGLLSLLALPAQAVVQSLAPNELTLTGTVRDFKDNHPDFEKKISGLKMGCVHPELVNGLPVGKPNNACKATRVDQWFTDIEGINQSRSLNLTLKKIKEKNGQAIYRYENRNFFPIDHQLFGNQNRSHNYHFTFTMALEFSYQAGVSFTFSGDDDVWVFVDNKLVLDLGGVHARETKTVTAEQLSALGLQEGQIYPLNFFFAERHTTQSNFILETSIPLQDVPFVDVWVSDPAPDQGEEPNWMSRNIWRSPDIWVRNQEDGIYQHQNVKAGQDNFVYVNIRNRGTLPAYNTTVELYRINATLGRGWPNGWELIGTTEVSSLAPQAHEQVMVVWEQDQIPRPGHYCFYVRLLNDDDPISFPETRNAVANTRNNNNIAWRNFNVIGLTTQVTDSFELTVHNPQSEPALIDLVFEEQEGLLDNPGAHVIVDLGELFDAWEQAGAQGEHIEVIEGTTRVILLDTPAQIIDIPMTADEQQPITMTVEAFEPMPGEGTTREYHFSAQEWINDELVGGVDYSIVTRAEDSDSDGDGTADIYDEDNDNDGIPDAWEIEQGLNPLNAADATVDNDGDGSSNLEEYQSGTDPNIAEQAGDELASNDEQALLATVTYFQAIPQTQGGIVFKWETASEINTVGYNLWQAYSSNGRCQANSTYTEAQLLNRGLINSKGDNYQGATYRYYATSAQADACFGLEEVELGSTPQSRFHIIGLDQ